MAAVFVLCAFFHPAQATTELQHEPPQVAWNWPLEGRLTSQYGMRWGRMHAGIDIAGAPGRTVRAAGQGMVSFAGRNAGYGLMVEILHPDGYRTRYAHLSQIWVRRGDLVETGEPVGPVGNTGRSTGPHLHFELRKGRRHVDPLPLFIRFGDPQGARADARPKIQRVPHLPPTPVARATTGIVRSVTNAARRLLGLMT